jgi:hypothetical protein
MRGGCVTPSRVVTLTISLVAAAMLAGAVDAVATQPAPAISSAIGLNPLLTIDQNRTTVVDRIVARWGDTPNPANQITMKANAPGTDLVIDIAGDFKEQCAPSRYVDNGDGTVTDNKTGLMWEKELASSNPGCTSASQTSRDVRCEQNTYTWSAASPYIEPTGTLYTEFLVKLNLDYTNDPVKTCFANHCDWRIPTIDELQSILLAFYPRCYSTPCIDPTFGPTEGSGYWSSGSLAGSPGSAWGVSFGNGGGNFVKKSNAYYARAVRGGR